MRIEVTDQIGKGRCEVRTEWCRARACGVVGVVLTPDGTQVRTCGACLEEMNESGAWYIPGTRPRPWPIRHARDEGDIYTPNPDAITVEPGNVVDRGRCQVQTERCVAPEWGVITAVTTPDCKDIWLCWACLERMAVCGVWDLGWSGVTRVVSVKRFTQLEAAAHAA